jgi:Pyruvate/2-oxoacid:ferredoxin oxidoreductase delta subunit
VHGQHPEHEDAVHFDVVTDEVVQVALVLSSIEVRVGELKVPDNKPVVRGKKCLQCKLGISFCVKRTHRFRAS